MENWQFLQNKISKMKKEEFFDFFASMPCWFLRRQIEKGETNCPDGICDINCRYKYLTREHTLKRWIIHRTLRREKKEIYIINKMIPGEFVVKDIDGVAYSGIYCKDFATKFTKEEAIVRRNRLNQARQDSQYLWLISEEK